MIEDTYEELIDGKIDTYECVIIAKELIAEVKRLRKQVELLEWAEKTHPAYLNNLKKGFKGYQNE